MDKIIWTASFLADVAIVILGYATLIFIVCGYLHKKRTRYVKNGF